MPGSNQVIVHKASGDVQGFSSHKIERFLKRIMLPNKDIKQVVSAIKEQISHETSTQEITQLVTKQLGRLDKADMYCARYNLKPNIRKFGPDGHTFEKYIGRLFEARDYDTQVSVEMHGKCVTHEVDIWAEQNSHACMVEAKFHNKEGIRSDVTIAMYTNARFMDISAGRKRSETREVWLATNTKLTHEAFKYAECSGMKVLSIELPSGDSILERVIKEQVYPICSVSELDPYLRDLYENDLVLLSDILELDPNQALTLHIPPQVLGTAQAQARRILGK